VLQLLDRLVDRRLVDFGEMAGYLLKTINLLMLRLLQYAPREATVCATLSCLCEKAKRPSERQLADLLLKCLTKLTKTLTPVAPTISLHLLLQRLHELRSSTAPAGGAPVSLTKEALEAAKYAEALTVATDDVLRILVDCRGPEVLAAMPPGSDATLGPKVSELLGSHSDAPPAAVTAAAAAPIAAAAAVQTLQAFAPAAAEPTASAGASPSLSGSAHSPELVPSDLAGAFDGAAPSPAAPPQLEEEATEATGPAAAPIDVSDAAAPAEAPMAVEATDSVTATALAKLKEMKRKYNIQTSAPTAAPDAAGGATPAAKAGDAGDAGSLAAAEGSTLSGASPSVAPKASPTVSPTLNVAALRSRLARLKKH
jgi:hypothetical protein